MGYTSTLKFIKLGHKQRPFRQIFGQPHKRWEFIKTQLDKLVRHGRIETTLERAKEIQQYAEELIIHSRKDCKESDIIVESLITSPEARSILYEKYVPLYAERPKFFTRVVNQWHFRTKDSASMAYLEFIDRPGELRPAKPVGSEYLQYVYKLMGETRRNFRKYKHVAKKFGFLDQNGRLVPNYIAEKQTKYQWQEEDVVKTIPDDIQDQKVLDRLEEIREINIGGKGVDKLMLP